MYALVPPGKLITILGTLAIVTFILLWLAFGHPDIVTIVRITTISAALLGAGLWVIGTTGIWRYLWRRLPRLSRYIYPDINGIWVCNLQSNWEKQRARLAGEKGHDDVSMTIGSVPDNNGSRNDKNPLSNPKLIAMRIKANWFHISIIMETNDDYSTSETITVIPRRALGAGNPKLYYIYHNITRSPQSTDEACHDGAAWLEIVPEPLKMRGLYWTNRKWTEALNTAGAIDLYRYETDPLKEVDWNGVRNSMIACMP